MGVFFSFETQKGTYKKFFDFFWKKVLTNHCPCDNIYIVRWATEKTKKQQTKLLNRQKQNMQLWRNWHTRKTKDLVSLARTGSSPVNCIFLMCIIRKTKLNMQLWRNWHTRMIQVHVHVLGYGFKSHQLHWYKEKKS